MSKIIITGAGGFIGKSIAEKLAKNPKNQILAIDNNFRGSLKKIKFSKNIKKIKKDITSRNGIKKFFRNVDFCYHLAAINGTKNFYEHPKKVLDVGIKGTLNILDLVLKYKVKNFIFFSSSEAYQTPKKIPTKENEELKIPDVFNPRLSYGGSKILGELLTINYLKNSKTNFFIFRPHNVYGPDMGNDHVIPELIKKINYQKKNRKIKIKIFGNGNETRAFIYISDAVNAMIEVVKKAKKNQIYNIGSNDEVKIKKLILTIGQILNKKIKIIKGSLHRGSVSRRCPDVRKLRIIGHKNSINLKKGLLETIKFYWK